jgi:large conductance mechanosensitive channel
MLKGFRDFILRGNVVDLAVAVIIGAAFGAITSSLTASVLTPFIAALFGTPDFSSLVFHMPVLHQVTPPNPLPANYIPPGEIHYGILLNAIINFLIVAFVIYFFVVLPISRLLARLKGPEAVSSKACPECLSDIPLSARRCKFCAEPVA